MFFWIESGLVPRHSFQTFLLYLQSLLLDVVHPTCWYADFTLDTIALDKPQRLAVLVTCEPMRQAPTMSPLNSVSHLSCGLQYFMHSCAIALLIQPSHSSFTDGM